jgi:hypothetical protein
VGERGGEDALEHLFLPPLLWGGWVAPTKITKEGNGGSRRTPALLFTHSLALARHVGREMLDEHLRVVLEDVMDGRGKRLEINVRPVLAAEFQIILESREVHAGLGLVINISVKNISRHRSVKMKLIIAKGSTASLALDERDSPHARSRWSSLGRTTLTAATGEYNEESERAVVTTPRHSEVGCHGFLFEYFWGQRKSRLTHFYAIMRPREQPQRGGRSHHSSVDIHTRILARRVYNLIIFLRSPNHSQTSPHHSRKMSFVVVAHAGDIMKW